MKVIRADRLLDFGKTHADARIALAAWLKVAESADWRNIQDLRITIPHADAVKVRSGKVVTVFNVKGNRYRLIAAIDFPLRVLNVLTIMTHAEYNQNLWKGQVMSGVGTVSKRKKIRPAGSDYLKLIKRFPIRPLQSKEEYLAAGEILDELIGREDLTDGERDYVAALVHFVEDFDKSHARKELEKLAPLQILKHLMEERDMSTTDLGYILGSRGLASEVLHGKRGLSKMLMSKLGSHFGVDAALFLDRKESNSPPA